MTQRIPHLVLAELASVPWAIRPETLERIAQVARRQGGDLTALASELGEKPEGTERVTLRDGIAYVHVGGPMFRYGNLYTQWCGATSYAALQRDLQAADAIRGVRAIVLCIDSPGGEVRGLLDTAELIARMRRPDRPLVAHVDGSCCSAAVLLAAACDRIVADPAAVLGCVGAMIAVDRWSEEYERDGVISFVSSTTPLKNASALEPEGASQLQRLVDESAAVYFAAMARYLGVDAAALPEQFGRGAVMPASDALAAGLCRQIQLAEDLHAALLAPPTVSPPSDSAAPQARGEAPTTTHPQEAAPMAAQNRRVVAAAYEPGAAVRATQPHEVTVAAGDEGTVAEIRENVAFYAVEMPGGVYAWLPEDEIEAAEATPAEDAQASESGDTPEEQTQARARLVARRVRGAVQAARAGRERARIAALRSLDGVVPRATIDAAIADPAQTAGAVALAHLQAQAKQGSSALKALADDAKEIPPTPGAGDDAGAPSLHARAAKRAAAANARFAARQGCKPSTTSTGS